MRYSNTSVVSADAASFVVEVGDFTVKNSQRRRFASKSVGIVDPDFSDLILITLHKTVEKSRVIPLCKQSPPLGTELGFCGMGLVDFQNLRGPEVLQEFRVGQKNAKKCYTQYFHPQSQICASNPNPRKTTCLGDSGGPLFMLGKKNDAQCLYGTLIGGQVNCTAGSIFVRIKYYSSILESTIKSGYW